MNINNFVLRMHTKHTEEQLTNVPELWTIQRGHGALEHIIITDIQNPLAQVKANTVDVPGASGVIDATEAEGAVFYKNKTVTVRMQTSSKTRHWFQELRDAFVPYQGRLVDFAFQDALDVTWYYTGRLSVTAENPVTGELEVQMDTYPFLQSAELETVTVPNAASIDRPSTAGPFWEVASNESGADVVLNGDMIWIFGQPGAEVILRHAGTAGQRYLFSTLEQLGCEIELEDESLWPPKSKVTAQSSRNNWLMTVRISGSHYDFDDDEKFRPCAYLNYDVAALTGACSVALPSNVRIRPVIRNTGDDALLMLDGDSVLVTAGTERQYPEATLPGRKASRDAAETTCCFLAVGRAVGDTPGVTLTFRREVLG